MSAQGTSIARVDAPEPHVAGRATSVSSIGRRCERVPALIPARVARVVYSTGVVVSLVAVGVAFERFGFDPIRGRQPEANAALVASIAMLGLTCFLMLRRMSGRAFDEMRVDKETSACLFSASQSLVAARDPSDVCETAARAALTLTDAGSAHLLLRDEASEQISQAACAGPQAERVHQEIGDALAVLADLSVENGSAVLRPEDCVTAGSPSAFSSILIAQVRTGKVARGAICVVHCDPGACFSQRDVDSVGTLASLVAISMRTAELASSLQNFFAHATEAIVTLIDTNLSYHQGHAGRVARLAHPMGRELGLDDQQLRNLHFAALLHDIGTLAIPPGMRHDRRACLQHPVLGYRMLKDIRLWSGVAKSVLYHHEWFDGSGYPHQVAGGAIPLESRIIAVCDAFDAMVSETSYKPAVSDEDALRELDKAAGTQFDPTVVRVVQALARQGRFASEPAGSSGA